MAKHFLVAEGLLTAAELQRVQAEVSEDETLNQALLRLRLVTEADLAYAASRHLGIPLVSAADLVNIPPSLIARLPKKTAIENRAIPVRMMGHTLLVAMGDPSNEEAIQRIRSATGIDVQRAVALESLIVDALSSYFGQSDADNEFGKGPKTLKMDRRAIAKAVAAATLPPRERRDTEEEEGLMRGTRPTDEQRLPPMPIEGAPTLRMPSLNRDTEENPQVSINPLAKTQQDTDKWPPPADADLDARPTGLYTAVRPAKTKTPNAQELPSAKPSHPSSVLEDWRKTTEVSEEALSEVIAPEGRRSARDTLPIPTIAPAKKSRRSPPDTTEQPKPLMEVPSAGSLDKELRAALSKLDSCAEIAEAIDIALAFMGLLCEQRAILNIEDGDLCGQAAAGGLLTSISFESFRIPMERYSVFGAVVQSQIPYHGPLLFGPEERVFATHIGRHPEQILLVPITVDDEVIGLLYGDGLTGNMPMTLVRELASAMGKAHGRIRQQARK